MADFTTLKLQVNTGVSDASPTWTDILFGTAGYELRAALSSGSQATNTSAANWPSILKPSSGTTLIDKMYAFTADTTGFVITGGDSTGNHYNVYRINWDALGTFASAPILSAWKDTTLPAASPGVQPGTGDGSSVINGTSAESSSTSLLKAAVYGVGVTAGGAADNPGSNLGSNPSATSGGSGNTATVASTWSAWKDLQAATNFFTDGATPKATTAGTWNFLLALYIAAGMVGGTLLPVCGFQYTWI